MKPAAASKSRAARHTTELISDPAELLAIAADYPIELGVPVYDLDDAAGLVDLIEREVLKK